MNCKLLNKRYRNLRTIRVLTAVILCYVLAVAPWSLNALAQQQIEGEQERPPDESEPDRPLHEGASSEVDLDLNSESAILIDASTGAVLYEKDSSRLMYPASITKIVTGIIAIEQGNLDDIVTVSENARATDGTRVYLLEGEEVPMLKLVQGLLINSGNDAGVAIAEHMDGSEGKFAERMNRFVREKIGVQDTTFRNPHGLFDPEHQTTAHDMALITQYAMKNELFRSIVGTIEMEWIGEGWETTLQNHNLLLKRYEGTTGVKNGYVSQSGNTLVSSAKRGDTEWITVTLKADSAEWAYQDTTTLFDYGFDHYKTHSLELDSAQFAAFSDRYVLPDKLVFTGEFHDSFTVNVKENEKQLVVINSGGETVYSEPLTVVPESEEEQLLAETGMGAQQNVGRTEAVFSAMKGPAISSKLSTGSSFIALIFVLFIFLYCRKLVRQQRRKLNG